jgi:hypothetical protein
MGIVAAVVAGVASVAGAAISAKASKDASARTDRTNRENITDTNQANLAMFDESRGSTGHAILPTYTGDAEKQTFDDLYKIYQGSMTPQERSAQAAGVMNQMAPATQGGTQYLNDVYSGKNLDTSRGYYQPLWDSRTQTAQAQADAIQQAYARTRQQQLATAQRQGYYGGSSVQSNEAQRALLESIQQAALARGAAATQNATEGAQLGITDMATRQQLLNEPLSRAQSLLNYNNLVNNAAYTGYDQLAQRLGMFNIGTGQFTQQNLPTVSPNINSGQIYGSALSNLAGSMGNAYMNQQKQPTYINNANATGGYYNVGSNAGYTGGAGAGSTGGYAITPSTNSTIKFGGNGGG